MQKQVCAGCSHAVPSRAHLRRPRSRTRTAPVLSAGRAVGSSIRTPDRDRGGTGGRYLRYTVKYLRSAKIGAAPMAKDAMPQTVLVAGAAGFIGSHLCD